MKYLLIVTALMSEAVPVIEFYRMKKQPKRAFYHSYRCISPDKTCELNVLVTGPGSQNMRRGLSAYLDTGQNLGKTAYLNFGIAGAACEPIGKLLWPNTIGSTPIGVPQGISDIHYAVRSVDSVSHHYQSGVLFDMEAETCLQCILENVQQFAPQALFCAKVVSDNQREHTHNIDKHWVKDIVQKNIKKLDKTINNIIKTMH